MPDLHALCYACSDMRCRYAHRLVYLYMVRFRFRFRFSQHPGQICSGGELHGLVRCRLEPKQLPRIQTWQKSTCFLSMS